MGCDPCGRVWLCVWACEYPCPAGALATEPGEALALLSGMAPPIVDVFCGCWPARWKTGTLARCAISTSPICQCIASAARHGSAISFEIFSHMSFLNL
jgi:hypothetical protein